MPMDNHDKSFLDRLLALEEENNRILRRMQRSLRWGRAFRILYWILVIGVAIGAFYYIQPYVDQMLSIISSAQGQLEFFQGFLGTTTPR